MQAYYKNKNFENQKKTWIYAGYPHILDVAGNKVRITSMSELERYEVKGTGRQIDT